MLFDQNEGNEKNEGRREKERRGKGYLDWNGRTTDDNST